MEKWNVYLRYLFISSPSTATTWYYSFTFNIQHFGVVWPSSFRCSFISFVFPLSSFYHSLRPFDAVIFQICGIQFYLKANIYFFSVFDFCSSFCHNSLMGNVLISVRVLMFLFSRWAAACQASWKLVIYDRHIVYYLVWHARFLNV